MTNAELEALRDKILRLPQADRFILAAQLLQMGKQQQAEMVAQTVMDEFSLARVFPNLTKAKR